MNYHDRPGLSFHKLKDLGTVSPDYFYRSHVTKEIPPRESDSMDFGTAVHCATLTPHLMESEVVVCPAEFTTPGGAVSSSKAARAWRDGLPPRTVVLSAFDMGRAQHMSALVRAHPVASMLLKGAECETEHFVERLPSITVKAKIDIIAAGDRGVWDLKTIKSLSFIRSHVRDYFYAEQIDWYSHMITSKPAGGLIMIESEEPHRVAIVTFAQDLLDAARTRWGAWLDTYTECQTAGVWPNDPSDIITLTLNDLENP